MNVLRRPLSLLALLLGALAVAGCDNQETLTDPSLTGRYEGFGGGYVWTLDLSDAGGDLTGTGTLTTEEATYPLTVEGVADYPVVGFALTAEGLGLFTFSGSVSAGGDVLTGMVASGEGFDAEVSFLRE